MPEKAIPLLLEEATGDDRELHNTLEHPLRKIQDWSKSLRPEGVRISDRRHTLFEAVRKWKDDGGDLRVALRCVPLLFEPSFNYNETDPGSGMKFYMSRGPLTAQDYERLSALWPETLKLFAEDDAPDWSPFIDTVHGWFYGPVESADADVNNLVREKALPMLVQLAELAQAKNHPGVIHSLRKMLVWSGKERLGLPADEILKILVPLERPDRTRDYHEEQKRVTEIINALADRWALLDVDELVDKLAFYLKEIALASIRGPVHQGSLWWALSAKVKAPDEIAKNVMGKGLSADLLYPFLYRVSAAQVGNWQELLEGALDSEIYQDGGILCTLLFESSPEDLVGKALDKVSARPHLAGAVARSASTPGSVLKAFLSSSDARVAVSALENLYLSFIQETLPEELIKSWESAFLRHARSKLNYVISEVLKYNPKLAHKWLEALLGDENPQLYAYHGTLEEVAALLDIDQRKALLNIIPDTYGFDELVRLLIGNEVELHAVLLQNQNLKHLHLSALETNAPDKTWVELVKLTLEHGYSPEDVARATDRMMCSWSGNESDYWQSRIDPFEPLLENEHEQIRKVAQVLVDGFERRKATAKREEHQEAIYGRRLQD